ncbi:hypothetical protein BFW01_g11077 [Lasiodiplodia theobromae]|uniref:uncharacterized protein n=1 Tax=Lasiodiplodia theobromae TaxID=45133 RepID=UPI0015C2FAA0|nr:uncharacterized protein LTHEOB_10119 [Lasiodiplodia theobromae]KAF4539456.1 hypothetical protein LTHEOB_10119 [Lasiodiplodia theobromae]KAF9639271.1 hypothetical protein BFW01_g11077 [Lasiodiplodia theobromae]
MSETTLTIWYIPRTPYPRRLTNYLLAKHLPRSLFESGRLQLIPVRMDPAKGTFETLTGCEPKPEGFTLPVLRVSSSDNTTDPYWITQSASILEYLEATFPAAAGFRDLSGSTLERQARTRDIVLFAHELMQWSNVQMRHGSKERMHWFGIKPEHFSAPASADAHLQVRKLLARVDGLVRDDVLDRQSLSLAGGNDVTIADCVFAAFVACGRDLMGVDWIDGMEALTRWYDRASANKWLPSPETIAELEKGNSGVLFVGEVPGKQ